MLVSLKNNPNVKFQIPKTIIEDGCNVSDIVHFNFPMNPVGEVSSLMQCTLTGPGGFKKDNVPGHLRTLDDSQLGIICPADTPDRDGCGVILNMIPTVDLKANGDFGKPCEDIVSSFPITLTPFMQNDDQTRLQMASNQMKQSILLKNSEKPFIRSGTEGLYMDRSTFLYRAKEDGSVVHLDPSFMVVLYKDGTKDVFKTYYRTLYQNTLDYLEPMKKEGEEFKKGEILCQSKFLRDGELCIGKNLLTGIAIWKGFNYEDGIVISESVSKTKMTSFHSVDLSFSIEPGQVLLNLNDDSDVYTPIPEIGQKIKKGQVFTKIKTLDSDDGFEAINIDPVEKYAPVDCTITSVEIYPNGWNKKVSQYNIFIHELMTRQADRFIKLKNKLSEFMDEEEIEKFITLHGLSRLDCNSRKGKYTFKGQRVSGVFIKIHAVYEEQIGIGDKVANRHGGKGVISGIIPDEKMPVLADGRKLEIIINPLGIISRMNAGQLFELHLNEALYQLKLELKQLSDDTVSVKKLVKEDLSYIRPFLNIIDKTPEKWVMKNIIRKYKQDVIDIGRDKAIDNLFIIQPAFQSITPKDLFDVMALSSAVFRQTIFDPESGLMLKNPISVGYMYFLKLVHRSSDKMTARSIGPYGKKTLQPLGGKSRKGGQRLGEMEVWAVMGHGATDFLSDLLTIHSDSPGLKNKLLSDMLENPDLTSSDNSDERPQSLRLLQSYFSIMGVSLESD
jgi:DNA-directed RNA polymerase subunit beta